MDKEIPNEFGDFGEIEIKVCNICGKTIQKSKCYGFVRASNMPRSIGSGGSVYTSTTPLPQTYICVKCLLRGLWVVCKGDRLKINELIDLFVKTDLTENI